MLYVGLDLSRKRLDWHALLADGERVATGACPPDRDGLAHLVRRLGRERRPVLAVIESMTGAALRPRSAGAGGLGCADRGCAAGEGVGAACL
jgi:hypothetical protein